MHGEGLSILWLRYRAASTMHGQGGDSRGQRTQQRTIVEMGDSVACLSHEVNAAMLALSEAAVRVKAMHGFPNEKQCHVGEQGRTASLAVVVGALR